MGVNFYLKKPEPAKDPKTGKPKPNGGKSLIYLQFKYAGHRLVFSFGQSIDPKNWNPAKQRVKSNNQTTTDGDYSLNDLLDSLEQVCEKSYKEELKNGIPQPETLKKHLVHFLNQNKKVSDEPTLFKLIDRFINNEIKNEGEDKSKATLKVYKTTKGHLEAFSDKYRYPIDFDTIDLDFFYKYVAFLKAGVPKKKKGSNTYDYSKAEPMKRNTIAKSVNTLKVFMNEAVDLGYTTNLQYKHKKFNVKKEDTDSIYLSEAEILKFYRHDFSTNKRLEQVRDLFVFGCFVGLRFSDYSEIKPQNIVEVDGELFIRVITKKTKELVIIPTNPIILQLFEKYSHNSNRLPKAPSNQKFNQYIKEAAKVAGFDDKGRLISEQDKELWECISSHTARRSFATNLYLSGFPTIEIMKITGHRTEKAFLNYIKVSKLDAAKRLSKHIQVRWSEKILKIAG